MFGPMDFRPVGCSSPAPSPPPPEQHYGPPCFHTVHEDVCSLGARPSVQPPLVSAGATPRYLVGFGQYRLLGPAAGLPDQRPAAGRLTGGLVFPPSCSIACPALSKDRAIDTPSSAPCRDGHDWQNGVHSSPPPAIGIHRGGSWQPVVHLPELSAGRIWPRGSLRDHAQICLPCLLFVLFSRDLHFFVYFVRQILFHQPVFRSLYGPVYSHSSQLNCSGLNVAPESERADLSSSGGPTSVITHGRRWSAHR
jgi:hypothetical protein